MSTSEPQKIVSDKSTLKNLELFLKIPTGLEFTGVILIILSGIFGIYDMEVSGYFLIAFAILLSYIVLITYKLFITSKGQKDANDGNVMNIVWSVINIIKMRIPAILLFIQFISIGILLLTIKDWVQKNESPAIFNRVKRFVNLGLLVQFIIYQIYYVKELKETNPISFNTCAFMIISLITLSLIGYLYVIIEYLTVDG